MHDKFVKLPQLNHPLHTLQLWKLVPIAKKAPVKLWQVPTNPHDWAEAPHTHQTVPARLPLQLHILYNFSLFYTTVYITNKLQHFYSHKKTPYSDHQRIGHRRVFPFFTFLSFIQLQTWYNFIPRERYQKRTFVINCKKALWRFYDFISYNWQN